MQPSPPDAHFRLPLLRVTGCLLRAAIKAPGTYRTGRCAMGGQPRSPESGIALCGHQTLVERGAKGERSASLRKEPASASAMADLGGFAGRLVQLVVSPLICAYVRRCVPHVGNVHTGNTEHPRAYRRMNRYAAGAGYSDMITFANNTSAPC